MELVESKENAERSIKKSPLIKSLRHLKESSRNSLSSGEENMLGIL
jgi:hypothetical protein